MAIELITPRLLLRSWQDGDRPALERMARDPEMMRYIRKRTLSDAEIDELLQRQIRQFERHGVCIGPVVLKENGEVIGIAGMQPHDDGQFELGWWVWKNYWGRGYATEAGGAFVGYARDSMGLERLVAVIDPPNVASCRVAEKLGMRFECIKSARETISNREDMPIAYYGMSLREAISA